jgi:hypothetical protein
MWIKHPRHTALARIPRLEAVAVAPGGILKDLSFGAMMLVDGSGSGPELPSHGGARPAAIAGTGRG